MGIAGIACNIARLNVEETAKTHAWIALTLHDAFVACWDEKYRSDRVRPETVIKKNLDPTWRPLLQTPPFPEYVSGHSVASTAAAQLLTHFFGNRFKFTDNTEVEFGLPIRKFKSFNSAADEACISRLYGGIHFRDAIDQGKWQGEKVASMAKEIYESMYK
jgi:membrane-associated phospholipid phosphatase